MTRRVVWLCLVLFLLALVLRATFLLFGTGVDAPLGGDEPDYHGVAVSFLAGTGWRDPHGRWSYRPPLISAQFVALYALTGPDTRGARWLMVLTSALTAPALFLVALRLLPGRFWTAVLCGAVWAFYPRSIYYGTQLCTENMAALLSLGSLAAFAWTSTSPRRRWLASVTGLLWGLMTLNRPAHLLLPLALVGAQTTLSRLRNLPQTWSLDRWLVGLVAVTATLLPWTVRNYRIHRVIMPTTSGFGWLMMQCNATLDHPVVQDGLNYKNPQHTAVMQAAPTEVEWDRIGRGLAWAEIRRNCRLLPSAVFNRAVNFWIDRPNVFDPGWSANDLGELAIWIPTLLLFALSFRMWSWRNDWPALVMIAYAFVFVLPFWGGPRFRFPVDPLIILRAVIAASSLWERVPRVRRWKRQGWG